MTGAWQAAEPEFDAFEIYRAVRPLEDVGGTRQVAAEPLHPDGGVFAGDHPRCGRQRRDELPGAADVVGVEVRIANGGHRQRCHRSDRLQQRIGCSLERIQQQNAALADVEQAPVEVPRNPIGALGQALENVFLQDAAREQVRNPLPGLQWYFSGRFDIVSTSNGEGFFFPLVPHREGHDVSLESASADVRTLGLTGQGGGAAAAAAYLPSLLAEPPNSPYLTSPRNACHSPGLNRRTGPAAFLLSRTPTTPPGRLATSTQL